MKYSMVFTLLLVWFNNVTAQEIVHKQNGENFWIRTSGYPDGKWERLTGNFSKNIGTTFSVYTTEQVVAKFVDIDKQSKASADSVKLQFRNIDSLINKVDTTLRNELVNAIKNLSAKILSEELEKQIESKLSILMDEKIAGLRKEILTLIDSKQ